jgi:hypothetical protein
VAETQALRSIHKQKKDRFPGIGKNFAAARKKSLIFRQIAYKRKLGKHMFSVISHADKAECGVRVSLRCRESGF